MPTPAHNYFSQTPWCKTLLTSPAYTILPSISLATAPVTPTSTSQTLFTQTLSTSTTIPHSLTLAKIPAGVQSARIRNLDRSEISETLTLLHLASGLNGHPDTLHGASVAAILNGVAGMMAGVGPMPASSDGDGEQAKIYTAGLNVRFLRPVRTPGAVGVRGVVAGVEWRKKRVRVEIVDGMGDVLAVGEALFVRAKGRGEGRL